MLPKHILSPGNSLILGDKCTEQKNKTKLRAERESFAGILRWCCTYIWGENSNINKIANSKFRLNSSHQLLVSNSCVFPYCMATQSQDVPSGDNCPGGIWEHLHCVSDPPPQAPSESSTFASAIQPSRGVTDCTTPNPGTSGDVILSVCGALGSYSWHESAQSYLPGKRYCRKASTHSNALLGLSSPPPVSKGRLQKCFKDRVETLSPFKNNWNSMCLTFIALLTSRELLQAKVSSTAEGGIQSKTEL